MQTTPPYPLACSAPGFLDPIVFLSPIVSLSPTVSLPDTAITSHPATGDRPPIMSGTNLPPVDFLLLADRLAELYEMVFPEEPDWLAEEICAWADEEDVAEAAARFLRRVGALFPVHEEFWEIDLEGIEWRLHEIPLIAMGFDEWYDTWDDLKEPAPYLLHMSYSRGEDAHDEDDCDEDAHARDSDDEFTGLYPEHPVPRHLDPSRLVEPLRRLGLPEPLDALPDLLEMLHHSTGNAWLDIGELGLMEGGGYPLWDAENVVWLAEEWRKAQPTLDRVHRLLDWRSESPDALAGKLTAVRDALLAGWGERERELEKEEEGEENG